MSDEGTLRDKARAAIRNGKLPTRSPDRTWGGPGVGAECAICGLPVTKDEMEFEIQFARDGDNPGLVGALRPVHDSAATTSSVRSYALGLHQRRADAGARSRPHALIFGGAAQPRIR